MCGEVKPLADFHRDKSDRMGRARRCKPCACTKARDWVQANPEKAREARTAWAQRNRDTVNKSHREAYSRDPSRDIDAKRKYRYGVSRQQYDQMIVAQGGRCAVCGDPTERLHVDHDHATGDVRGLLCRMCNQGLGFLRDNIEVMRSAVRYLERP